MTHTAPVSSRAAIARARRVSAVQTLAPRPNGESLAQRTISSSVSIRTTRTPGPKSSSCRTRALRGSPDKHGRLVEPARELRVGTSSTGRCLRSVLDRVGDEALESEPLRLADERPKLDLRVEAVAEPQAAGALGELLDERVVERRRHGDPLDAGACLSAVRERAPERAVDRAIEVGVVQHEHRVLAAELEHGRAKARGGGHGDLPSGLGRAREDHRMDAAVVDERLAHVAGALHDADKPWRRPRPAKEVLDEGP